MKYGIYLPNFGPCGDARTLAGLARDAEDAGWDGFFLWDHIAGWNLPFVDPWVALTAVALSTQRIRIGTTVTPVPRRRPWKLARETVSVDRLSGGRLTLGVGIGIRVEEWDHLGEQPDLKVRGQMLDESLAVLDGLWSGEPFEYSGRHYHVEKAQFLPTPVQQPRIPVWVGGFWPNKAPFRRAAQWDGVFPLFQADNESQELAQLEQALAYTRAQRQAAAPLDVVCMGFTPGDDTARAADIVGQRSQRGGTWWLESLIPFRFGKGMTSDWTADDMRKRILQGPPLRK